MLDRLRGIFGRTFKPLAQRLLKWGVTPDAVTIVGTLGVILASLILFPMGHLFAGTMVVWFFAMSDAIDGLMARLSGRASNWGAFLDSNLDRMADAAIFTGLGVYLLGEGENLGALAALTCLIFGSLVPYARAKAEGLGYNATVGIAERGDRLLAALVAAGLVGLGLSVAVLVVTLVVLAAAAAFTLGQRMYVVYKQVRAEERAAAESPASAAEEA